jgi:hypothetical protein
VSQLSEQRKQTYLADSSFSLIPVSRLWLFLVTKCNIKHNKQRKIVSTEKGDVAMVKTREYEQLAPFPRLSLAFCTISASPSLSGSAVVSDPRNMAMAALVEVVFTFVPTGAACETQAGQTTKLLVSTLPSASSAPTTSRSRIFIPAANKRSEGAPVNSTPGGNKRKYQHVSEQEGFL